MVRRILCKIKKLLLLPIRKMQFADFGRGVDIRKPIMITGKACIYLGDGTFIRENARIEAIQRYHDKVYHPQLHIGKNVTIEQGLHLTCSAKVDIGDNTTISSYAYISDTSHGYRKIGINILNQELEVEPVTIGKCVFVGTGVKILPGVSIGDNSIIGANAVVTKNIPCNSIAVGIPARVIKVFDATIEEWVRDRLCPFDSGQTGNRH